MPFGIEALPGDLLRALRALPAELPAMRRALEGVGSDTATLEAIAADVHRIADVLSGLPDIGKSVDSVSADTSVLRDLRAQLDSIDRRMAALEESMQPVGNLADRLPGSGPKRS